MSADFEKAMKNIEEGSAAALPFPVSERTV